MSKFRPNNNNNNNGSQPQQRVPIATTGPSYMVQQMAARNFALKNGGQMPTTMVGAPNGNAPAVAAAPMSMNFFQQNGGATGKYEAPVMQQEPDLTPSTPAPAPEYGTDGVQFANPSQPQQNDMDSLSAALNGAGVSHPQQQVPEFQADPNQRDGGFFNWIKGLMPKKRPGRREGETDDEYDARRTRNMEMWATFADAIRHMGNIVNTAKGAPLQQFNDPTAMLEQGYQNRKAQRQKQAALDADAAYKQANMSLKERAAEADRAYKQLTLGYKDSADRRAQRQFEYQVAKDAAADQYKRDKDKRDFEYKQDRDKAKDEQTGRRLAISEYNATHKGSGRGGRSGKGGSGSGGKYWFEDKNGKMHYQPNKTMWEQEYYREYGKLPQGETSTSTSTKVLNKDGSEKTVTTRSKGNSMTAQAAASQNAAKAARNKGKSGGSKGHGALNAWFKKNNK